MSKTMRNVIITCILLIAAAGCACALVLGGGCSSLGLPSITNPFSSAKVAATNAIIDSSGIKDRVESELYAHVNEISAYTGLPAEAIEEGISTLAIKEWKAVEKPAGASETGNYSIGTDDTQVGVTTYDDPSVVTLQAYGQEITLSIPDSVQQYSSYLSYLGYL